MIIKKFNIGRSCLGGTIKIYIREKSIKVHSLDNNDNILYHNTFKFSDPQIVSNLISDLVGLSDSFWGEIMINWILKNTPSWIYENDIKNNF